MRRERAGESEGSQQKPLHEHDRNQLRTWSAREQNADRDTFWASDTLAVRITHSSARYEDKFRSAPDDCNWQTGFTTQKATKQKKPKQYPHLQSC